MSFQKPVLSTKTLVRGLRPRYLRNWVVSFALHPTLLINVLRKWCAERSGSNPVLLEHLKMLKETFWEERNQTKRRIEEIPA